MTKDSLKETLKRLGMTNNEIEIYLTLLQQGELSVNEIGSKSGLHRQVCYDALDRLLEKGFVSYITKNGKKFFNSLHPEKILDYLEEKKEEVNSILPELNTLFKIEKEETNVEIIKGKMVFRTIYNDMFKTMKQTREPMYAMGVDEKRYMDLDEVGITQYIAKLRREKLKEKLLSKKSATFFFEGPQSEYRLLPDHLFNPNTTHIYGNKVAILIWGNPLYGIIIHSKQVADANRKYFEILWKMAKKR
ncbi:helix-turn-helix domain-containing protein [Candidatus Woesearchaeota archaeon]|nr:helix-turn-helix domain-containing protein [Candidatus Woesearchaeota archaeon]